MRQPIPSWLLVPLALAAALAIAGCNSTPSGDQSGKNGKDDHAHDRAHPAHGPHNGHLVELGQEEYHAEWMHDDSKVTVYILDSEAKKEVPITASKVTIIAKDPKGERSFDLLPVNATADDMPTAFQFESEDKELLGAVETLSDTNTATLRVEIDGKSYEGKLSHDHGHAH